MAFTSPLLTFLLLLFTTITTTLAAKASPGCSSTPKLITPSSSPTRLTTTIASKTREYFVLLPPNFSPTTPHRLVLTLHALGGTASQVIAGTGGYVPWYGLSALSSQAVAQNASKIPTVFVAPNGLDNGWANTNGNDVSFIQSILTTVTNDLCIDTNLVFSTGFSFGGAMSYMLACSLPANTLRGVAVLSGNPQISGSCAAATQGFPVAYYGQHGMADSVLPIDGGRAMRDRFVKSNGCSTIGQVVEPAKGSGQKHAVNEFQGCAKDKPVVWAAFDGDHTPTPKDKGDQSTWTPAESWRFFERFV
ncbi:Alpha/Beta hydrolase protein [Cercophora scortea]|uniref:Feruloyl esterase C n=1 Tax=Cercophora scortea TaxID=314031 RepID=A0AAE0I2S2_9PEZI|nr:Alpha/Beta hydrolase protein [Cercophora scortea]